MFSAFVDKEPVAVDYKLLQLKKYLRGEALRLVDGLRLSPEAYKAAKNRLDRKYGGQHRQINLHMEELDQFRSVRDGNMPRIGTDWLLTY